MSYLVSSSTQVVRIPLINELYQHLYYRRTRRLDVPLITELRLLPEGEEPQSMSTIWRKVPRSTRTGTTGLPPQFLWYKAEKTALEMSEDERKNELITELDATFGEDVPWFGFEKLNPPTTPHVQNKWTSAYITFRRGVKRTSLGGILRSRVLTLC
jgi:hypothetical protein